VPAPPHRRCCGRATRKRATRGRSACFLTTSEQSIEGAIEDRCEPCNRESLRIGPSRGHCLIAGGRSVIGIKHVHGWTPRHRRGRSPASTRQRFRICLSHLRRPADRRRPRASLMTAAPTLEDRALIVVDAAGFRRQLVGHPRQPRCRGQHRAADHDLAPSRPTGRLRPARLERPGLPVAPWAAGQRPAAPRPWSTRPAGGEVGQLCLPRVPGPARLAGRTRDPRSRRVRHHHQPLLRDDGTGRRQPGLRHALRPGCHLRLRPAGPDG
jgi:hypothetical protein